MGIPHQQVQKQQALAHTPRSCPTQHVSNNDYFMKNRSGSCKFLNVLQGENPLMLKIGIQQMKDYCDPKNIQIHLMVGLMGGQNMCDIPFSSLNVL